MVFENLQNLLNPVLDPVLSPLLKLPPLLAIFIISAFISALITFIYKFTTDQELMKSLKEKMKEHQKQMKEERNNPQKVMEIQKKSMEHNMKYMMQSMKSTLFTILPIIIIFGWLNMHMAYYPLMPGEEFSVSAIFRNGVNGNVGLEVPSEIELLNDARQNISDNMATWNLKGPEGEYIIDIKYGDETFLKEIKITDEREYEPVEKKVNDDKLKSITVGNEKIVYINLFGWRIGWLGSYIIFSLVLSTLLRKFLKIH
jgi:uncharacterized membrane protein (DUF106 family)